MTDPGADMTATGGTKVPRRGLVRTVIGFSLASGLPALANLAALSLFSRALGPEKFGLYALSLSAATLVQSLVFGFWRQSLIRFLHDAETDERGPDLLIQIARGTALSALAVAPVWLLLAPPAGLAACLGLGFLDVTLALHIGGIAPARYGLLATIRGVGGLALGLILLASLGPDPTAPLLAVGLAAGLAASMDWRIWRRAFAAKRPGRRYTHHYRLWPLMRFGLPISLMTAMGAALPLVDRAVLSALNGLGEAGIYAPAQDLSLQSLGLLFAMINLGAYPIALRAYREAGVEGAARQSGRNLVAFAALLLPGAVGLGLVAPGLSKMLFAPEFATAAAAIVPLLAAASFVQGIRAFVIDASFQITETGFRQIYGMGAVLAVAFLLDLALVPSFGAMGAAWAALAAQISGFAVSYFLARKLLPWQWPWRDLVRIVVAASAMIPAVLMSKDLGFLGQAAIGAGVYALVLAVLMPELLKHATAMLRRPRVLDRDPHIAR